MVVTTGAGYTKLFHYRNLGAGLNGGYVIKCNKCRSEAKTFY